ncbi:MAG: hypothetical protein JWO44_410 [Bacteroidetes bacterium]|nr:hypothetical protein [Bacteroidota bacterium]
MILHAKLKQEAYYKKPNKQNSYTMKTNSLALVLSLAALYSCGPDHKKENTTPSFTLTVTEDNSFTQLPSLQSFVFANKDGNWLMFSGRTNGFHGFAPPGMNFPKLTANQQIYVYDVASAKIDSMPVPSYGGDTANVFLSTNLAHTQQGDYLYACGGYGISTGGDSAKITYSYFMRMQLNNAIAAVKAHDQAAFKKAVNWGKSDLVRSTGGELYALPDGNFYMALGHNFTGSYSDSTAKQVYLDQINVFSLKVNGFGGVNSLSLLPVRTITDSLPDSTTQFHRRDLVVAPCVQSNGTDIGLAIYGGVFTYSGKDAPASTNGTPFAHPIYTTYTSHRVDNGFSQFSNIYSAAFMSMYSSDANAMLTSFFGGLGDSLKNFAAANWTTNISTNMRSYANSGDSTTMIMNPNPMPGFIGAEGVFIPDDNVAFYNKDYKIIDYTKLTDGQTVGRIYGGIVSNYNGAGNNPVISHASGKVYKVVINIVSDKEKN